MATGSAVNVNVNEQHVSQVMGIPNSGEDLVIVKRIGPSNRTYTLRVLEQNLDNLPVGDDFLKSFLIFSCATLLAPIPNLKEAMTYGTPYGILILVSKGIGLSFCCNT